MLAPRRVTLHMIFTWWACHFWRFDTPVFHSPVALQSSHLCQGRYRHGEGTEGKEHEEQHKDALRKVHLGQFKQSIDVRWILGRKQNPSILLIPWPEIPVKKDTKSIEMSNAICRASVQWHKSYSSDYRVLCSSSGTHTAPQKGHQFHP